MKRLHKALAALVLVAVLPFFLVSGALAEEVIRSYVTDIRLDTEGTVHVVETIEVRAEGVSIRRGIYRDIPTVLINDDGSKLWSSLGIVSIKRDGQDEPYHTEGIENGERIYIGDADVLLPVPGIYVYEIAYTMTRMDRRFADHDELYFNAIGPYWDFPILKAVANVTLPEGAEISDLQAYTGRYGSTEQAVAISRDGRQASFRATRPLSAYEGMTVSASFQKGILAEPSAATGAMNFLSDHRVEIVPGLGALVVLLYNLWAWLKVGRDPEKGTIIPLFYPPRNLSPARTHFIHRMGWRNNGWLAFTSGLIDLAVKGLLVLGKDGKRNTITATDAEKPNNLPKEEADLLDYFSKKGTVRVDKKTGPGLNTRKTKFLSTAKGSDAKVWFSNNTGYVVVSVLVSVAMLGLMLFAGVVDPEIAVVSIFVTIFLTVMMKAFGGSLASGWFARIFLLIWLGFFVANLGVGALGALTTFLAGSAASLPFLAVATIIVVNILFGMLMRAPTVEGRRIMDQIDGFKMYLETAEKERLNFDGEPQMTVTRFESILPYAVALGVEKPWTERFENDLARNAVADYDGTDYHPHWHSGSDFRAGSMGRDVAAFATGMSAAMIAAQPSSSSSSGGGGGGSSGGGGGGGGGGGW